MATYKKENMSKIKPDIFKARTREWDPVKGKYRQYRSTQGRSPKQIEGNYKAMFFAMVGIFTISIVCSILEYVGLI
jgi:hypothetical protein